MTDLSPGGRARLAERLREHVQSRGGTASKNGAWEMMLEAADALDRAEKLVESARPILTWVEMLPVKHPGQADARDRLREALEEYDGTAR